MKSDTQQDSEHRVLLGQLKDSFSSVYMTLLSIIQGVTLGDLASVVENNYAHFTVVHWLLALAMLGLIIGVWHQIMIDAISLQWIPDIEDAALPFVIGVFELLLNHLIPLNLSIWLFLLAAAICILEVVGSALFVRGKAEQGTENRYLVRLLRRRQNPYLLHGLSGIALFVLLGLLSIVIGFHAGDGVNGMHGVLAVGTAVLALVWIASLFFISKGYWHAVKSYARTGQMSDS